MVKRIFFNNGIIDYANMSKTIPNATFSDIKEWSLKSKILVVVRVMQALLNPKIINVGLRENK